MAPYKTPLIYLLFFLAAVVARPSPTVKRQGIAANPVCFNKGQGVERSDMISAVAWYCSIFNGDSFSNADTTTWYMTGTPIEAAFHHIMADAANSQEITLTALRRTIRSQTSAEKLA